MPVVICRTGASLRASRRASLSVARSPTSAATRCPLPSSVSVRSRSIGLPGAGARHEAHDEDARRPEALAQLAGDGGRSASGRSAGLRRAAVVTLIGSHLQWRRVQLRPPRTSGAGVAAVRAQRTMDARSGSLLRAARRTVDDHRHLLDHQASSPPAPCPAHAISYDDQQRVLHDARERPEPQVHRRRPSPEARRFLLRHLRSMLMAIDSSCIGGPPSSNGRTPPAPPGPG